MRHDDRAKDHREEMEDAPCDENTAASAVTSPHGD